MRLKEHQFKENGVIGKPDKKDKETSTVKILLHKDKN